MREQPVTIEKARAVGAILNVDWNYVDVEEFRRGLEVEQEHGSMWGEATNVTGDDPLLTGRIAWAHLKEIPDYYSRLADMEKQVDIDYEEEEE